MRSAIVAVGLLATIFGVAASASAAWLSGEYTITVEATSAPGISDSYQFVYAITNNGQQSLVYDTTGLDGFFIQVPLSATISNVVSPAPYFGSPGYWDGGEGWLPPFGVAPLSPGKKWLGWWGFNWESVYPDGTTAVFKFQADGVALGTTTGVVDTFWLYDPLGPYYTGAYYSEYSTSLLGPVAVPEPSALAVWSFLSIAGIGFGWYRKRRN